MPCRLLLFVLVAGFPWLAAGSQAPVTGAQPEPATAADLEKHADVHMARKEYAEAVDAYLKAVRLAPKNAVLLNKTGIAYHQQHRLPAAKDYYKKAIKIDAKYAEAINNLGTISYAQKNYRAAIRDYNKSIQLKPSAPVYSNLGTAYFARKMYPETIAAYAKAVELDPEVFEKTSGAGVLLQERTIEDRARFHFFLAKTFAAAGNLEKALDYLKKAFEEGFKDRDAIVKDTAFAELAKTEPFQQLLANPPAAIIRQ